MRAGNLSAWQKTQRLVLNLPTPNKIFKYRWFWILGEYRQFTEDHMYGVPNTFKQLDLILVNNFRIFS